MSSGPSQSTIFGSTSDFCVTCSFLSNDEMPFPTSRSISLFKSELVGKDSSLPARSPEGADVKPEGVGSESTGGAFSASVEAVKAVKAVSERDGS